MSEAMHHLGIPTTRSLAVVLTGENVQRYISHEGAILTRIAASHLRVGTFEYISHILNNNEILTKLLLYSVERHYPKILDNVGDNKNVK